ncbi:MAG: helix-turn-helix domain-containing protein [Acidimicrobiia bacterium]
MTLAAALTSGMADAGLGQKELAERANVSTATLRKLAGGSAGSYRPQTLARVARALGWPSDALSRLLEGSSGEPTIAPPAPRHDEVGQLVARIRLLPGKERRAVNRLVEELLLDPEGDPAVRRIARAS